MRLVLIETSGNQSYIFATNKLRENVGASELTHRVGTRFVLEAVRDIGGSSLWKGSISKVREALIDPGQNPPLDKNSSPVEVILAASGKALLLVHDEETGKKVVRSVSQAVLKAAPGIEATGVIGDEFELATQPVHDAIRAIHRLLEESRGKIPGSAQRFLRLPVVAECQTSGLPAARFANKAHHLPEAEYGPRSAVSLAKHAARKAWQDRVETLCAENNVNCELPNATTELEKLGCDWVAVVHADGNGLGQVFLNFDHGLSHVPGDSVLIKNRMYIDKLRCFSLALDDCTERAFCSTIGRLRPGKNQRILPIVPLVLGGDDLTIVCDGRQAMRFAVEFLKAFEAETRKNASISETMQRVKNQEFVSSCAGVAIVKPHFPFYAAYALTEDLLQSAKSLAKQAMPPLSAVDFHVLYDASGPDLKRLRQTLTVDKGKTILVARPYAVTPQQGPGNRRLDDLVQRLKAVRATDDDNRRLLPNSMLHDLREGLFRGREQADARLQLALGRHDRKSFKNLIQAVGKSPSLFWREEDGILRTGLLDAMDLAEFWPE
jgi:hypothetical protein